MLKTLYKGGAPLILLCLPALCLAGLPGFAAAATLMLSPQTGAYKVGDSISVEALLNTEGVSIDGVDVRYLNYDPKLLEVIQVAPGTLMPVTVANKVDTTTGKIEFSQITTGGSRFSNTTSQNLVTVQFKVLQVGNAALTLTFTPGDTRDANVASAGKDILTSVTNAAYTLNAADAVPTSVEQPAETSQGRFFNIQLRIRALQDQIRLLQARLFELLQKKLIQ